ncbi:MAG: hypothetical protein M1118_00115, partial [Chloroflexi bacterium]|nr:hypothetical protein [Chloroflexota bacterium]
CGILPTYNILAGIPGENPDDYEAMAAELPKLVHLRPPTSVPKVEFHRFSPYYEHPEQFGLRLRPVPHYRYLYPFSDAEIARIAYLFEREDADSQDLSYVNPLIDAIFQWRGAYDEDRCTLTWQQDEKGVLITDCRPGFPQRRYRLQGYAVTIFQELDAPRSLSALLQQAKGVPPDDPIRSFLALLLRAGAVESSSNEEIVCFSAAEFLADPEQRLAPLLRAGLLFEEQAPWPNQRYLALPVRAQARVTEGRWLKVGV